MANPLASSTMNFIHNQVFADLFSKHLNSVPLFRPLTLVNLLSKSDVSSSLCMSGLNGGSSCKLILRFHTTTDYGNYFRFETRPDAPLACTRCPNRGGGRMGGPVWKKFSVFPVRSNTKRRIFACIQTKKFSHSKSPRTLSPHLQFSGIFDASSESRLDVSLQ